MLESCWDVHRNVAISQWIASNGLLYMPSDCSSRGKAICFGQHANCPLSTTVSLPELVKSRRLLTSIIIGCHEEAHDLVVI